MKIEKLHTYQILRPAHPHRSKWDEEKMSELVESIKQLGLIEPIIVEPMGDGYRLIAGDRRLEAHHQLGLHEIDAIVRDRSDRLHGDAITWAENLAREELAPMDQARQVAHMRHDSNMDIDMIARTVNRSKTWVEQRLALVALPIDLIKAVEKEDLATGAALALGRVSDATHRAYLTRYTLASGASIGVVRDWVSTWEAEVARGEPGELTRPPMPITGQPYIIRMPCWLCHQPHDHNHLLIERVCRPCALKMQDVIHEINQSTQPPLEEPLCETRENESSTAPNS